MLKRRIIGLIGLSALFVAVFFTWAQWRVVTVGDDVVSVADAPVRTVAIVFGASVHPNGEPSDVLEDRLLTAIDLYQAQKVGRILVSGDNGQQGYDEVNGMRAFLLEHGVAPEHVFLDHAGFDSYDTIVRASKVFQIEDALLVTQAYHLPRVLYIAKSIGIDATGVASDRRQYLGMRYYRLRETAANIKAVINVLIESDPAYLGDPIPISGDGRGTWDEGT